jgi:hypothetical protein
MGCTPLQEVLDEQHLATSYVRGLYVSPLKIINDFRCAQNNIA